MNSKTISSPFIRGAKGPTIDVGTVLALAFLALLVVAAILLWQAPSAVQPISQPLSGERFLAQNPELSVARRYAVTADTVREEWFLARNPELMVAARYASSAGEAAFLAQNPELSIARRYTQLQAAR